MKKQIIIPVMLFMLSLSLAGIGPVNAQTKEYNQTEQKTWIKYEGSKDGIISFDISYNNPGRKKISIAIYDEQNNNLFEGIYHDGYFHKKFQLSAGEANELLFVLKSADDDLSQSFKISSFTQTDVAVTKL